MSSSLLLVDAMSIAYRAFYAIRGLSTPDGQPTNAVFGFIKTLGRVRRLWSPTHCLVVFDGGAPAARLELLPSYKAQRPPLPQPLKAQLGAIREYLDCVSIKHLRIEEQEADDVMASTVEKARASSIDSFIMSGDKDMMQLVDENTFVLSPASLEKKIGSEEVLAKTGVRPDQLIAWLAMIGDSSDNIPGVPGVGSGTAAKWLIQWGSLESILENVAELNPARLRSVVLENKEILARNIKMVTLNRGLDIPINVEDMKLKEADESRLLSFYEKLEFHSLARDLKEPSLF